MGLPLATDVDNIGNVDGGSAGNDRCDMADAGNGDRVSGALRGVVCIETVAREVFWESGVPGMPVVSPGSFCMAEGCSNGIGTSSRSRASMPLVFASFTRQKSGEMEWEVVGSLFSMVTDSDFLMLIFSSFSHR